MKNYIAIIIALLLGCGTEDDQLASGTEESGYAWAEIEGIGETCEYWVQIRNALEARYPMSDSLTTIDDLDKCSRPELIPPLEGADAEDLDTGDLDTGDLDTGDLDTGDLDTGDASEEETESRVLVFQGNLKYKNGHFGLLYPMWLAQAGSPYEMEIFSDIWVCHTDTGEELYLEEWFYDELVDGRLVISGEAKEFSCESVADSSPKSVVSKFSCPIPDDNLINSETTMGCRLWGREKEDAEGPTRAVKIERIAYDNSHYVYSFEDAAGLALADDIEQNNKDYLDIIEHMIVNWHQRVPFDRINNLLSGSVRMQWKTLDNSNWNALFGKVGTAGHKPEPLGSEFLTELAKAFMDALAVYKVPATKFFAKSYGYRFDDKITKLWYLGKNFELLFPKTSELTESDRKAYGLAWGQLSSKVIDLAYNWRSPYALDYSSKFDGEYLMSFSGGSKINATLFDRASIEEGLTPACGKATPINAGCFDMWGDLQSEIYSGFMLGASDIVEQFSGLFSGGRFDLDKADSDPKTYSKMLSTISDRLWKQPADLSFSEVHSRVSSLINGLSDVGLQLEGKDVPYHEHHYTLNQIQTELALHQTLYSANNYDLSNYGSEDILQSIVFGLIDRSSRNSKINAESGLYKVIDAASEAGLKDSEDSLMTQKQIALSILHDLALALGGGDSDADFVVHTLPSLPSTRIRLNSSEFLKVVMYGFSQKVIGLNYEDLVRDVNLVRAALHSEPLEEQFFSDSVGIALPMHMWRSEREAVSGDLEPFLAAVPGTLSPTGSWADLPAGRQYPALCIDADNRLFITDKSTGDFSKDQYRDLCGAFKRPWAPENASQQLEMDRFLFKNVEDVRPVDIIVWIGGILEDGVWESI